MCPCTTLECVLLGILDYATHVTLASSTHHLPSNLVSSLGLPVWLKPHKLLVTRLPSKKTSLDLSLDLGLTDFLSVCHHSRVLTGTLCPHTTPECVLLEIWLCSLCNIDSMKLAITFGPGRVKHRLCSSSEDSWELAGWILECLGMSWQHTCK